MEDPTALPSTLRARALTRQADWAPKSEVGLVECGLLNPRLPARPPVRPTSGLPVRPSALICPSACSPLRPTTGLPVRQCARPPVRPSARAGPRPCLLDPVRASSAYPRVRAPWALSARPLHYPHPFRPHPPNRPRPFCPIRSSARPPDYVVSACPPVRPSAPCTHRPPRPSAPSATSAPPARDSRRYIYSTPPPLRSSSSSQSALGPESLLRL